MEQTVVSICSNDDIKAEVLGKRVVVQHIPLGGLVAWDTGDSREHQNPAQLPANDTT